LPSVQRRHRSPCTRQEWDQRSCAGKGAKCPILIRGMLIGSRVQLSTAKLLPPEQARELEAARALALEWERAGFVGRLIEYAPVTQSSHDRLKDSNSLTVEGAVTALMADSRDRGNSESTLQKEASIFQLLTARDPRNREGLIPSQPTACCATAITTHPLSVRARREYDSGPARRVENEFFGSPEAAGVNHRVLLGSASAPEGRRETMHPTSPEGSGASRSRRHRRDTSNLRNTRQ
jgi:hypothetical protein